MMTLCFMLSIYSGEVSHTAPRVDVETHCKQMKVKAAEKKIAKCMQDGPEKCEVTISPDKKRITLESKILVSAKKEEK